MNCDKHPSQCNNTCTLRADTITEDGSSCELLLYAPIETKNMQHNTFHSTNPAMRKFELAALLWLHTWLTQHWFTRASHSHLLSHSSSAAPPVVICWQCCLRRSSSPFSHAAAPALPLVWNSLRAEAGHHAVINNKREGERIKVPERICVDWTLRERRHFYSAAWRWLIMTVSGPLTGTGIRPICACELTYVVSQLETHITVVSHLLPESTPCFTLCDTRMDLL